MPRQFGKMFVHARLKSSYQEKMQKEEELCHQ
jgi:hypothetical protein